MAYPARGPVEEQPGTLWDEERFLQGTPGPYFHIPSSAGQSVGASPSQSSYSAAQARQRAAGGHWRWDSHYGDYVQEKDGLILRWTEIQRPGPGSETPATVPAPPGTSYDAGNLGDALGNSSSRRSASMETGERNSYSYDSHETSQSENAHTMASLSSPTTLSLVQSTPTSPVEEKQRALKPYETPLDPRFRVVDKPKRFFAVGRIFKAVWFEPGVQQEATPAGSDADWTTVCPPFHDEKPFAKFRWFLVVRKRLHHSLCFSITTFGGKGATKASRGRARDFVVLYPAGVEAPEPFPEENIDRNPLAVIIEEGQQYISPVARVDCGRIYTVEDNLKVMKIGRVHPDSLGDLEQYYKESVS